MLTAMKQTLLLVAGLIVQIDKGDFTY